MKCLCAVLLGLSAAAAGAESTDRVDPVHLVDPKLEFSFEARARALFLGGKMKFDEEPSEGDVVRLSGDLGLDPAPAASLAARVLYESLGGELGLAVARATGRERLDRARAWNESHFAEDERVRTTLTWTTARLSVVWKPFQSKYVGVEVGGGGRWDRFALRLNGDGDTLGIVAPECGGRILLYGGYGWEDQPAGLPGIDLDFRVRAFGFPGRRASALGWSTSLGFRLQLAGWLHVGFGFSYESARWQRRDSIQHNRLSLTSRGPYLELTVNF